MKIKKGDTVLVTAGKDKGVKGEVLQCSPEKSKVLVEGAGLVKKHVPAEKSKGAKTGQRVELPTFLDVSNVKVICPKCKKAVRVGHVVQNKEKKRVCKKCKEVIDKDK